MTTMCIKCESSGLLSFMQIESAGSHKRPNKQENFHIYGNAACYELRV